jgi:hypothetical protein
MSASLREHVAQGVRAAIREALFFKAPFSEPSEVRYREGFDTACWVYQPPHVVVIGWDIYKPDRLRPQLTASDLEAYAANFYHHEIGHARYTTRAGAAWVAELDAAEVPFRLYNLFEDARIEAKYVKDTGRRFRWLDFERATRPSDALGMFFALIQSEGGIRFDCDTQLAARVRHYYESALKCQCSEELLPILQAWVAEFPQTASAASRFQGELEISHADAEEQVAFLSACSPEAKGTTVPKTALAGGPGVEAVLLGASGVGANSLPDPKRVLALAGLLQRVFTNRMRRSLSATPSKRISVKHYVRGDSRFYRQPRALPGEPEHLLLVLDCSGSMNGPPVVEARILIAALSELVRSGFVRVTLLLSATLQSTPSWQRIELPMAEREIASIHACGNGEALQATLLANLHLARRCERTMVFTDAELTDEPVNKPQLNKFGVYTTGLYVGERSRQAVLERYFDRNFVRDSIEDVALALVQSQ